jgi:hypothetical protein
MRRQRCRRRFAVGAGDRNEGRIRRSAALAAEKLDVADDLDAGAAGRSTVQCGLGCVSGTPGDSTKDAKAAPIDIAQIDRGIRRRRGGDAVGIVVPGGHVGAAGLPAQARSQAGPAEAEEPRRLAPERLGRDQVVYLPQFERRKADQREQTAMIQKRITTWLSVQPSFSKWWWIGAIRNTRLPVSLKNRPG